MKKGIKISVLVLMLLLTTGWGKKTLTCTYNDTTVKYEIKNGKVVNAYRTSNGETIKATEEELESMKYFNSDSDKETIESIKSTMALANATCK